MSVHVNRRWLFAGAWVAVLVLGVQPLLADTLTFGPYCDNTWQNCCDCGDLMKCINWNRPATPAPVCPALPSTTDKAIVNGDCIILPPPAPGASADDLQQLAGVLTINGGLAVNTATLDGTVDWLSSAIARGGAFGTVTANQGINISGPDAKTLSYFGGLLFISNGVSTWTGDGAWTIGQAPGGGSPAIFRIPPGSTFNVQTDAPILQVPYGFGTIDNQGTLNKLVTNGTSDWKVYLNNSGLVHVQSGTLRLTGSGEATGEFRTEPGATFIFASGFTMNFNSGAHVTGGGETIVESVGSSNAINVAGTADIDRMTVLSGGKIGGAGQMIIHDLLTLEGAQITVPISVPSGAEILATGGVESDVGDITVDGTARVAANSSLATVNLLMTINPGGVVELEDGGTLNSVGLVSKSIENYGTIRKLTGAGTGTITSSFNRVFNHHAGGLIHAGSGTIAATTYVNSQSGWQADAGGTILLTRRTVMDVGSTCTGDGLFILSGNGGQSNGCDLLFPDGVHLMPRDLQLGDGTTGGNLLTLNGTIGDLTVSGTLRYLKGIVNPTLPSMDLTIPPGGLLSFENENAGVIGYTTLHLGGTAIASGAGNVQVYGGATWNIEPTGLLDLRADVAYGGLGGAYRTWNNAGTLVKSGGANLASVLGTNVLNTGTVRVESGTLFFDTIQTFTQTTGLTELAGGAMIVEAPFSLEGGGLQGEGTLSANVNNTGGTVKPGAGIGTLTIGANSSPANPAVAGNYTQGADGTLEIELGGLTAGTQHDQLVVAGKADLHGQLHLKPAAGFLPQVGDSFVVLTAAQVLNGFDSVTGPGSYEVTYPPGQVVVTVVTPPCSLVVAADFDQDCDVDADDVAAFDNCASGPAVLLAPGCELMDLDHDNDVDQDDFSVVQRCHSGTDMPADPNCVN